MAGYRERVADGDLSNRLQSAGAVAVEGAKACGKTATARNVAASEALLDEQRVGFALRSSGEPMDGVRTDAAIADIADAIAVGGWPGLEHLGRERALETIGGYIDEIARVDVSRVDAATRPRSVGCSPALARNIATHVSATTLAADAGGSDGPLDDDTAPPGVKAALRRSVAGSGRSARHPRAIAGRPQPL